VEDFGGFAAGEAERGEEVVADLANRPNLTDLPARVGWFRGARLLGGGQRMVLTIRAGGGLHAYLTLPAFAGGCLSVR
jgi:hypothetical protein